MDRRDLTQWSESSWVEFIGSAPFHAYGKIVGAFANLSLPRKFRQSIFLSIASNLGMDLAEAELPLSEYDSFGELFVRRLKKGTRPIDHSSDAIVSPVDGCVSSCGVIDNMQLIQAKGINYSLYDLVGSDLLASEFDGGDFVTIYLRPKDYHRIHCPLDCNAISARRIPGTLFPVQPWVVCSLRGLFARNERLVLEFDTRAGKMIMVCVGASGVGTVTTVLGKIENMECYDPQIIFNKGDEIAAFNLGSTVIVLFQRGRVKMDLLSDKQELRFGQKIAQIVDLDDE